MKEQMVSDWMTKDPLYISPDTTLPEAHKMMKESNIRRLPVLEAGKLVGIITLGDVREASPSDVTSLSIYELNYMLSSLKVSSIMTGAPQSVLATTSLHDAAKIMLEHKIGGLPVLDNEKLVGIITETDIFRAIVQLLKDGEI